jgi:hypothetical protein
MDEDLIGGGKVMGVAQVPLKQVNRDVTSSAQGACSLESQCVGFHTG